MNDTDTATEDAAARNGKVERAIAEYDLVGIGEEMERLWSGDGTEQMSLRELAEFFNEELLRREMEEADVQMLAGECENTYTLLVDDDQQTADRTRAVRRLEREGVDVDQLRNDFVSYQSIRRYLTESRDVEYERDEASRLANTETHLQQLRTRTLRVTESKITRLNEADDIEISDEFRTTVDIRVYCPDCGARFEVVELLENHGCDCTQ